MNYRILGVLAAGLLLTAPVSAAELFGSQAGAQGGDGGRLVKLDSSDASTTLIGVPFGGVGLPGIEFLADGRLVAVSSVNHDEELDTAYLLEIDPATGAVSNSLPLLDSDGNGCAFGDIALQPNTGVLFAMTVNQGNNDSVLDRCGVGTGTFGSTGGHIATIDPATGVYTIIGRDPGLVNIAGGIAFAPDGTLYFTSAWEEDDMLHTLDPATGEVLTSSSLSPGGNFFGLAWHPEEDRLYGSFDLFAVDNNQLATIDPGTGNVTLVGLTEFVYHGLAFRSTATPLPVPVGSFGWLLLLAVLMAAVAARVLVRRRGVA